MTNAKREDDYDDMSATFRAMKEHSKEKRRSNLKSSTELLTERGVKFDVYNNGVHLVIRSESRAWDFWPSTGKWRERPSGAKKGSFPLSAPSKVSGRGVFNLLKQLEGG
jgi:hypothetical protein